MMNNSQASQPNAVASPFRVLQGATSNAWAKLFIKVVDGAKSNCFSVEGPFSKSAETLTSTYCVEQSNIQADAGSQYFQTEIPDPLFWTPRNPAHYRVKFNSENDNTVLSSEIGIRDFHIKGTSFYSEDRRWVLRAAATENVANVQAWQDESLAAYVSCPSVELCRECSQLGLFLIADLSEEQQDLQGKVEQLCNYPAVACVVLPADCQFDSKPGVFAPHLILGCKLDVEATTPDWAKFLVRTVDSKQNKVTPISDLPEVLLYRSETKTDSPQQCREACDALQQSIAGTGEFAGIWVVS